ncbi:MAG: hypothetical protein KC649_00275, partial [Candidatus Omnitrophica bacterium]|nr:hypothetical protein [Candidatus Omnitrophota bacterium]
MTVKGNADTGSAEHPFYVKVENRSTAEGSEKYWVISIYSNDAKGGRYRYSKAIRTPSRSKDAPDETVIALWIHQAIFENSIQSSDFEEEEKYRSLDAFFDEVIEKQILLPLGLADGEGYLSNVTRDSIAEHNSVRSERMKKVEHLRRSIRKERGINQEFGYTSALLDEIAEKEMLRIEAEERAEFQQAEQLGTEVSRLRNNLDRGGQVILAAEPEPAPKIQLSAEEKMANRIKTRTIAEFFKWTAAAAVFGAAAGLVLGLGFSTVLAGVPVLGAIVSVSAVITLLTALTRGYHLIGVLRGVSAERNTKPGSPLWNVTDGWGRTWVEASDAKPEDADVHASEASRQWTKRVLRNRSYQAMITATEHAGDAEKRKAQFADFKRGALAGLAIILSVKALAFFGVTALGIGAAAGLPIVAGVLIFGAGWALIHGFHRAVIEKVGSYDELFGTEKGFVFGLRTLANIVAGVPIHLIDSFFTRFLRHRIHYYWAGGRNKQWLSDEEIEAVISAGNEIGNRFEKTSFASALLRKTGLDRSRAGNILSEVYEASLLGGLVEFAKRRAGMAVFSVAFGFLMPVLFTSVAGFAVFTGTTFGFYSLLIASDSGLSGRQKLIRIGAGALIFSLIFAGGHWLGSSPPEWLIPDAAHRVPGFNLLDLGNVVTPGDLGIESLHSEAFHFTVRSFVSSFPLAFSLGFAGKYTQTANLRAVRILNSSIVARLQLLNPASDPDLNLQEFTLREVSTDEILRWIKSVRHAAETGLLDAATASSLLRMMRHAVSDSADRIRIEASEQTVVLNRLDLLLRDYPDQTEPITNASSASVVFIENLRNLLFKTEFWIGVLFSSATMWFVSHEISALTHYAKFIDMYLPVPVVSALVLAVEGDHDAQHKLALYQRSGADVSFFENLRSQGLLGSVNYAIVHLGGGLAPQAFTDYLQNRETNRAKSLYEAAKTDEERLKSWHYLEFLKVSEDYQRAAAEYDASREVFLAAAQEHPDSAESDSLKSFRFVAGDRHDLSEAQVRQWLIDDYQVRTGDFSGTEPADLEVLTDLSMRLVQLNQLKHAADVSAAKSSIYAGGSDLSGFNQFDAREFLFQSSGVERDDLSAETIIELAAVSERMLNEAGYSFEDAAQDAHEIILKAQKEKIRSDYADKTVRISSKLDQIRRLTVGLHGLQVPDPNLEGFDKLNERLKMDRNRESDQVDQRRINVLIADVQSLLSQMDNALIDARLLGEAEGSPLEDIMIPGMDLDDIKEAYLAKMLPSGSSANPYNMHLFDYASAELLKNEPLVELFGADYMQQRIDKIRDGIIETEIGLRQNDLDGILSRLEEERLRLNSLEEQKRIAQGNGLIILSDGSVVEATDEDVKGMMRVGSLTPQERKLIPESLRGLSDDEFPDPDTVVEGNAEVNESTYVIARDTETGIEYVRIIPGVRSLEKYRQDMVYQSDAVKKMDLTHAYLAYRTSQAEYQSKNQIKDPEKYTTVSLFRVYSSDKSGAVEYRLSDAWMDSGQIITLDSLVNDPKYADKAKLLNIELADTASEFDRQDVELTLNGKPMILSRFQPVAVIQFKNPDGSYRYALAEARFNRQDWVKYTKNWEVANNYQSAHQRADQAKPVTGLLELRKEFLTAAIEEERSGIAELEGKEQELRSQLVTLKEQMVSLSVVSANTEPDEEAADKVGLTEEEDPEWTDPETVEDYYMQMIQFKIQSFGEIIKSRAAGLQSHAYAASEDETNRILIEKIQEIEQKIEVFRVNGDIRDEDAAAFKASVNSMKQVFLYGILTHTDPAGSQFEDSAAKMKSAAESMGLKDADIQTIIDLKKNFYAQTKNFTEFDDSVVIEGRTAPQILADLSGKVKNLQSAIAALESSASDIKDYDSAAADAVERSLESFKIELERISIQIDELQKKGADETDLAHLTALADELRTIVEFSQKLLEQERSALEYGEALVQQNRRMDGSILENMIGITEQVVQQYGILHERLSLEADRQERFKYTATDEARAEVLREQARIAGAFHRELAEAYISYHIPGSPVVSDADMEAAKEWAASVGIPESEFNVIADRIMNERRSDLRFKSADPSSDEARQLETDIKYESLRKLLTLLYNKRGEVEYEMQMVLLERQREEMLHNADGQMKQNLVYWEVHAKNVGVLLAQADIQAVPWYRRKTKVATADKRTEAESVYLQEDLNMLSASISPRLPYDTMDGYDSAEAEARRIFQQYGGHLTNTNNLEPMLALRRGITEWYVRGKDIREERQLKSIDAMIQLMQIQERLSNIERYVMERLAILESRDPAELTIREKAELARIRQKLADQQTQQEERKASLTQASDRWSEEFEKIQRIAYEHHPGLELSALAHLTENEDLTAFTGDVLFQGSVRALNDDEKQHLIRVSDLPFYERRQVEEAFVDAAGEKVKVTGDMYVVRLAGDNKGLYALVIGGDILDAKEKARVRLLQYELEVLKIWGKPSDDAKLGHSEARNYYLWLKYTKFGWKPNLNSMLGSPYWQPMYGVEDGTLGAGKFSLHKNSEDFNQEKIVWNFWRYMQSLDLLGFVVEDEFAGLSTSELHDVITASVPAVGDIRSVKDDKDAPVYAGNRVVGYRLRHHMLDNLTTIGRLLEVLNEEQRAGVLEKMNRQHLTLDSYVLPSEDGSFKVVRLGTLGATIRTSQINSELRNNLFFTVQEEDREDKQEQLNRRLTRAADDLEKAVFELEFISRELNQMQEFSNKNREDKNTEVERLELIRQQSTETITDKIEELKKGIQKPETSSLIHQLREQLKDVQIDYLMRLLP